MVHVAALEIILLHGINHLRVAERRKRNDIQTLRDTTRKQARSVRAWQNTDFATEHAYFVEVTAIWSFAKLNNTFAYIIMERHREGFVVFIAKVRVFITELFGKRFVERPTNFVNHLVTFWVRTMQRFAKFSFNPRVYL